MKFDTILKQNLRQNWFFPISASAYFCLNATTLKYLLGLPIAFLATAIIAARSESLFSYSKAASLSLKLFSALTAAGICWGGRDAFIRIWSTSSKVRALTQILPISVDIISFVGVFGAVCAFFSVFLCLLFFWKHFVRLILDTDAFKNMSMQEWIIYSFLLTITLVFVSFIFLQTDAFYATEFNYDIIYTSDSPMLVKQNVYLSFAHGENDLRQPLFSLFSAPFIGLPFLVGKVFQLPASVSALLMNYVQILLLFATNFMLTRLMDLSATKRICFMLLSCCTYTQILSVLMMEQYIFAYFWLILCVFQLCKQDRADEFVLFGAGGTLLTSFALLPFSTGYSPLSNFKAWFKPVWQTGVKFCILMLIFCRLDVFLSLFTKLSSLFQYTGRDVAFTEKFYQYTTFLHNCFLAPDAGLSYSNKEFVSWQLVEASNICYAGVLILFLAILSVYLNRDKRISLYCGGWVFFSLVILFVLGWGTQENGLILYSLYFAWAFFVLLFQLLEKITQCAAHSFLFPFLCLVCSGVLLIANIPAAKELLHFAVTYFPL